MPGVAVILAVAIVLLIVILLVVYYRAKRTQTTPNNYVSGATPSTANTYAQGAGGANYGAQISSAPITTPPSPPAPVSVTTVTPAPSPPGNTGTAPPPIISTTYATPVSTNTSSSGGTTAQASGGGIAEPLGVTLFQHINALPTDGQLFLAPGTYSAKSAPLAAFNNQASSLRVSSGCTAQFWANNDFTGRTLTITGPQTINDLGPTGLKNDISAIVIRSP